MPGFDGFSVVKGVMEIEPPLFVFVTAYQEHAVRAFEANAVNYLMKPVDEDRWPTRSTACAAPADKRAWKRPKS
jgi:two-component system LytT family response regulator